MFKKKIIIFLAALIFLALIISNALFLIKFDKINEKFLFLSKELANDGCDKSQLKISPDNLRLGYFIDLNCINKNNLSTDYENHTSLRIVDLNKPVNREIYKGSYHTSYWEWLSDNEVIVYYGCGTECMAGFVIDANTGVRKAQLQYGVGYEWAPNKKMVLAYNYTAGYGITIGNKENEILFIIRRDPPNEYNDFVDKTKALWSPDSSKLALIIKKENSDEMEILVFEATNFGKIFQSNIKFAENTEFVWENDNKIIYGNTEFLVE
ncbi:MAG: hypothetical protein V1688_01995 [bacterium]